MRLGVALVAVAWALLPGRIWGQRIGLFFDANHSVCATDIVPFGPSVHVWIWAFPDPDSLIAGATLQLQLPPNLQIPANPVDAFRSNRNLVLSTGGDLIDRGLDLRFFDCVTGSAEPLLLGQFGIADVSPNPNPRHNLTLHLTGGSPDSMTVSQKPQFLICDPNDPHNTEHFVRLLEAPPVDATLNCTTDLCYCTTAVQRSAWSGIKLLYQGR